MRESVKAKAERLVAEGRVTVDPGLPRRFEVRGDHGVYVVTVGVECRWCSCPIGRRSGLLAACSHVEAALLVLGSVSA